MFQTCSPPKTSHKQTSNVCKSNPTTLTICLFWEKFDFTRSYNFFTQKSSEIHQICYAHLTYLENTATWAHCRGILQVDLPAQNQHACVAVRSHMLSTTDTIPLLTPQYVLTKVEQCAAGRTTRYCSSSPINISPPAHTLVGGELNTWKWRRLSSI